MIAERYRVVAQVGRGGMGEVYRADDLRLGQSVALKFLPESLGRDDAALARLTREVRTARQVSHPNVCRVFDIGEAEGVPFITMEFVDGEDLASLLQRIGRLQPAKALQLSHQLCAGLAEIHAFGILHRDLKPANIMLDGRGNLRITDFGLAVVANEIPGEEAMAGTPAYMAPEQLAGEKATQQSDIYALGLILFELFTGMPRLRTGALVPAVR
jgi:serine/threonine protein kinase